MNTNTASRIPFWRQFRWNLVLYSVLVALVPIVIVTVLTVNISFQNDRERLNTQMRSLIDFRRTRIDDWTRENKLGLALVLADSYQQATIRNLLAGQPLDPVRLEALNESLRSAVRLYPSFNELFVYNTQGKILVASNEAAIDRQVQLQPYYNASLAQEFYLQPPSYEVGTQNLSMVATQIIRAANGQVAGVLAARLNTERLTEILVSEVSASQTNTYLVSHDNNYFLTPGRFEGYPQDYSYHSVGIDAALSGKNGSAVYPDYRGVSVIGFYYWVPELQAGLIAEIDESEVIAKAAQIREASIQVAVISILIAGLLGFFFATMASAPILKLTQVATRIAGGELELVASVKGPAEVGQLAGVFNHMTNQLQALITSLEERIAARTQRLEIIASLSERLTAILDLENLLVEMVNHVKEAFGFYHVQVYLLDEQRQHLIMTAGVGEAGAKMKAAGHQILVDAPASLVARAARTGEVVRVDNVREAKDWLPNSLLPNTYAEMAVPITLEGQVVGVLDVQADKLAGLDEGDANLLRSLASQVAVAIRNARLFAQVEAALVQARAAQEKYIEQAWQQRKDKTQKLEHLHAQSVAAPALPEVTMAQAKQLALTQKRPALVTLDALETTATSLVAPITLSGKTIGVLQAHRLDSIGNEAGSRTWTDKELAVIETVLDQVAQAAENLRLFEETRERAAREQTVREITDKLRAAPNLDSLLETAARELGQQLGIRHTVLELGIDAEKNGR